MADFEGNMTNRNIKLSEFATLSRVPGDLEWAESVQYDAHGRGRVVAHMKATATGRLKSETPTAGFVGPSGLPCQEATDGARPVWIWWNE